MAALPLTALPVAATFVAAPPGAAHAAAFPISAAHVTAVPLAGLFRYRTVHNKLLLVRYGRIDSFSNQIV